MMCIGCYVPSFAAETASTIRLTKTEGSVTVSSSTKSSVTVRNDMRLYSGYHVKTGKSSYAWLSLDSVKAAKLDSAGEVEIRKDGKKLEILVVSGNLSFNVSEPLKNDESLNIRTSTMVMGIRGTCGVVKVTDISHTEALLLHGTVKCSVENPVAGSEKTVVLTAGERAEFVVNPEQSDDPPCEVITSQAQVENIPGFVLTELAEDEELRDEISEASGLDLSGVTTEQAQAVLEAEETAVFLSPIVEEGMKLLPLLFLLFLHCLSKI